MSGNTVRQIELKLRQLWVADITDVRLAEGFVYLAVVIDAFSRKVAGWALDDHLEARLAIEALDMAITARRPAAGPHPPFRPGRAVRLERICGQAR